MDTRMHDKIFYLFLLVFAVVTAYSEENIVAIDEGTFEDLPKERKMKIDKIKERLVNEKIAYIQLLKNDKRKISIVFNKSSKNKKENSNSPFTSFYKNVKTIKIDKADSNSIKKAKELYEKNALKLFKLAGYQKQPGFSLRLDTPDLSKRKHGACSEKNIFKEGRLTFSEYYNGIIIESEGGIISFDEGEIKCIKLEMFANQGVPISGTKPKMTSRKALEKYLSSSDKLTLSDKPKAELCYFPGSIKTLLLCWKVTIYAKEDTRIVYINALTGQTEEEWSRWKRAVQG